MKYNMGIYGYFDLISKKIVYVGKDSHIDRNNRKCDHESPSRYNKQIINKIIQKNPLRYKYVVFAKNIKDDKELNFLERSYIKYFDPKFNFTEGGEGIKGFKLSEETKQRISKTNTGRKLSESTKRKISEANKGEKNSMFGKHHTEETKKIISEKNSGENSAWWGKKHSEETKRKISESHKGRSHSRDSVLKMRKNKAKYKLWNASKVTYVKQAMFNNNPNLKYLRKCFIPRYEGYKLSIGLSHDFITCEIINDLISEECD